MRRNWKWLGMVVLSACQVLGVGDTDIHRKAKTPAFCGPTFYGRHHTVDESVPASLYQVEKTCNAGRDTVNGGAVFLRILRVSSDEAVFEQGLWAEAEGCLGGRYSDPGEGWWWL